MNNIDFKQSYNRESFVSFLNIGDGAFMPDDFKEEFQRIDYSANRTKRVTRLGVCSSLGLDVFEVIHNSIHDARVELSKETFRMLLTCSTNNRALVVFVPQDDDSTYRLSLVSIEVSLDENKVRRSYSNPRRYSFVLGTQAKVRTPEEYLINNGKVKDWEDLKKRFSVEVLTKAFYSELSDWYSWAISVVKFPGEPIPIDGIENKEAKIEHNSKNVIRLLTRLLFVWFLKQKQLIPTAFFDVQYLTDKLLKDFDPYLQTGIFDGRDVNSVYYRAILQNLFFAMLNCPIKPQSKDDTRERGFRKNNSYGQHRDANYLMRYENLFKDPANFLELANGTVPFLNGGLFDCLDNKSMQPAQYVDGFSDNLVASRNLFVPDYLFFDKDKGKNIDLTWFYGDDRRKKSVNVRGLINILETYNFTIEENTPYDQEVSLDPELLGKVFENLLASYNPETKTTARKQTGSFYTPREIVQYMVDESLIAHLKRTVGEELEEEYRKLMQYTDDDLLLTADQKKAIVKSLFECKIIDPACGSGAFPMGILQQMVHILTQLDPDNESWKEILRDQVIDETSTVYRELSSDERADAVLDIECNFNNDLNRPDYARKLYLIEKSIYGVDIQPIAVQISKLRFFISLVVEQKKNIQLENFGIRTLPNLEAKFVAANTLIGLDEDKYYISNTVGISAEQEKLKRIRHKIFSARQPDTKRKLKEQDREVRERIATMLKDTGFVESNSADKMAAWDPYDQNASSSFFDPKWMFGVSDGFDIVIANPPYIDSETMALLSLDWLRKDIVDHYKFIKGNWDMYMAFLEKGLNLSNNCLCYITPDKWLSKPFGDKFRQYCMIPRMSTIVHAGSKVFKSATVDAIITLFIDKSNEIHAYKFNNDKQLEKKNSILSSTISKPYYIDSLFGDSNAFTLISKIDQSTKKVKNVAYCENACATSDAYLLSPIIINLDSQYSNNVYSKLINTGTIEKYSNKWGRKDMTYLGAKILYPVVKKNEFSDSFGKSYVRKAFGKKIIFKGLNLLDAFIDFEGEFIPGKSTLVIPIDDNNDLKSLCAILNSKLAIFYIKSKYASSSYCGGITFSKDMINDLPLPDSFRNNQQPIIDLVNKILDAKKFDHKADTSALEAEIDFMVYKLYGLTYNEILIIDPNTSITEQQYI